MLVVPLNVLQDVLVVHHQSGRLLESLGTRVSQVVDLPQRRAVPDVKVADWIQRPLPSLLLVEVDSPVSLIHPTPGGVKIKTERDAK